MVGYYHGRVFTAQFIAGGLLVLPFALTALCVCSHRSQEKVASSFLRVG
jgi:hypothetical protein